jgi:hypothetical protein
MKHVIRRPLHCLALLGTTIAAAIAVAAPAQAAPRIVTDYAAPYGSSSAPVVQDCTVGATCRATAAADTRTGRGSAAADFSRDVAATGEERVEGAPSIRQSVQLPKGSTGATVTATWHVTSATASALSARGLVVAGSQLFAKVECDSGCVAPVAVTQVTLACDEDGVTVCLSTPGTDGTRAAGVDFVVTADVKSLAKPSFTFWTEALAFVDAHATCGTSVSPTDPLPTIEDCSTTIDAFHAGTAHSDLDATLVGFHVDAT